MDNIRATRLTVEQKGSIERGFLEGVSNKTLAKILGISEGRIRTYVSRNKMNFGLEPAPIIRNWGEHRDQKAAILSILSMYPKTSVRSITGIMRRDFEPMDWYPSRTWIFDFIKSSNKEKLKLQLKPPINQRIKNLRLEFAHRWLDNGQETLGNIIWTDETMIRSHPSKKRISQWIDKGTPMKDQPVQVKKHSDGFLVMFWGCFSKHAFGPIVNVNGSMNGEKYKQFIEEYLLPELDAAKHLIGGNWRLMHDNAPCHRSRVVTEYLNEKCIEFIEWPPYSPELNPIENIWAWMKNKLLVEYGTPETEEELIAQVREVWENIPEEMAEKFCGNYERRLQAVIEANGGYTKY